MRKTVRKERDSTSRAIGGTPAEAAKFSPFRRTPLDIVMGRWTLDNSPLFIAMDLTSRLYSPYDLNPGGSNPLRGILNELIDFERVAQAPIKLFITATNVRTGRGRIFRNPEDHNLTCCLLRPACRLSFKPWRSMVKPIGTAAIRENPTITPLIWECRSHDTILIPINPIERSGTPNTARDILNRVNEVSFNAVLLKELRMIALLRQVADPGNTEGAMWAQMRIHLVRNEIMAELGYSSKLNAEWQFINMLHGEGRRAADAFLAENSDNIGKRSSIDLDVLLKGV